MKPPLVAITYVLCSLALCYAIEAKEVQLGCSAPAFGYTNSNPIQTIASAVAKDKRSERFRVTWVDVLGSSSDQGTMLYDRKQGTLKFDWTFIPTGADYGTRIIYKFTRVRDAILLDLKRKYNKKRRARELNPLGLIDILPTYGCKRYRLKK
jgi:hypothetical protein